MKHIPHFRISKEIQTGLFLLFMALSNAGWSQIAINFDGTQPHPSAMLEVKSSDKGMLVPRMLTQQRTAILAPATGLLVYDTDLQAFVYFNGSVWVAIAAASGIPHKIADTDGNTQVQTEKNPNEDIIRFDLGGKEKMRLVKNADEYVRLEFPENGSNTFLGNNAGLNSSNVLQPPVFGGRVNTFVGEKSGQSNTTGSFNTATGHEALFSNTTGESNAAFGTSALWYNQTGSRNTGLGAYAYGTAGALENTVAIGYNAAVNTSNKVRIGNSLVTVIEGQVDWSFPSDARFKYNVRADNVPGLAFLQKLRPVTYQFDRRRYDEHLLHQLPEDIRQQRQAQNDRYRADTPVLTGFLAQEVEQACRELNFQFSGLHAPENDADNYSLAYGSFVPLLVKAMQEQQTQIEQLKIEIARINDTVDRVQAENTRLKEHNLQAIEARIRALENRQ